MLIIGLVSTKLPTEVIFFGNKDKEFYLLQANIQNYLPDWTSKKIYISYYFFQSNPLNIICKILYI